MAIKRIAALRELLAQSKANGGAREEDLLAVQMHARADHVPGRERGRVVIPVPVCMVLLAVVAVVAVALRLPPAPTAAGALGKRATTCSA